MTIFNRNKKPSDPVQTEGERNALLREYAIEYIISLSKCEKDKFFGASELIWQGYDKLNQVKTKHERAEQKEAKALGMTDDEADDLGFDLIDDPDEPTSSPRRSGGSMDGVKPNTEGK